MQPLPQPALQISHDRRSYGLMYSPIALTALSHFRRKNVLGEESPMVFLADVFKSCLTGPNRDFGFFLLGKDYESPLAINIMVQVQPRWVLTVCSL